MRLKLKFRRSAAFLSASLSTGIFGWLVALLVPAGLLHLSVRPALAQYDLSATTGNQSNPNQPVIGANTDGMTYNDISSTGSGNSQTGTSGGAQVQVYNGLTTQQAVSNLQSTEQGLLALPSILPGIGYKLGGTSVPTLSYLNYGFASSTSPPTFGAAFNSLGTLGTGLAIGAGIALGSELFSSGALTNVVNNLGGSPGVLGPSASGISNINSGIMAPSSAGAASGISGENFSSSTIDSGSF